METRKEVKTIQVDYECPKCKQGHLRPTGAAYMTMPPQYHHKCNNCDYGRAFAGKTYPYVTYESEWVAGGTERLICDQCGKYKRLQGNGIMHKLCECGTTN